MAAQPAHQALKVAGEDLKELCKRVDKLINRKPDFNEVLENINTELVELQPVVTDLQLTIESFQFRLSIKEVDDFAKQLKVHLVLCENFKSESKSNKHQDSAYIKQLYECVTTLKDKRAVLTGAQRPGPHQVATGAAKLAMALVKKGIDHILHEDHRGAKALFDDLYGRIGTLIKDKDHQYLITELVNVKSRLDKLQPLKVTYIEEIEERNEKWNFSIKEVEDLKKELIGGIHICEVVSGKSKSDKLVANDLNKLDLSLKNRHSILIGRIRKPKISVPKLIDPRKWF